MSNLFFYTRKDGDKTYTESFNLNKVVRSVQMEDGALLILLDDLHERARDVQAPNIKTNKLEVKRVRETFQSEIYLEGEDITRFNNLNK
jgi:hypothetical protein